MTRNLPQSSDRSDLAAISRVLGSWWANKYDGAQLVLDTAESVDKSREEVVSRGAGHLLQAVSRTQIPVGRYCEWVPVHLRRDKMNPPEFRRLRYGAGYVHGQQEVDYGGNRPDIRVFAWKLPDPFLRLPLLSERITHPSFTFFCGLDYELVDGYIVFPFDPFARIPIADRSPFVDDPASELVLWATGARRASADIHTQFGYVVGLPPQQPETHAYRDLVNAVYDAVVRGPHDLALRRAIAAIAGIPVVREHAERVERIATDPATSHRLVITDHHVYRYSPDTRITVSVGDTVYAGDTLTNTLVFCDLGKGELPPGVHGLSAGKNWLPGEFFQDLTFLDKTVPTSITYDERGHARIAWELGGWPADVELFFTLLHERGVESGKTLAERLGNPATINPAKFLVGHLRRNTLLVYVQPAAGLDGAGWEHTGLVLRKMIAPHTAVLLVTALTCETVIDGTAGYTESGLTYAAMPLVPLTIDPDTATAEDARLTRIGGYCA